jgi:hypothetical protein
VKRLGGRKSTTSYNLAKKEEVISPNEDLDVLAPDEALEKPDTD